MKITGTVLWIKYNYWQQMQQFLHEQTDEAVCRPTHAHTRGRLFNALTNSHRERRVVPNAVPLAPHFPRAWRAAPRPQRTTKFAVSWRRQSQAGMSSSSTPHGSSGSPPIPPSRLAGRTRSPSSGSTDPSICVLDRAHCLLRALSPSRRSFPPLFNN